MSFESLKADSLLVPNARLNASALNLVFDDLNQCVRSFVGDLVGHSVVIAGGDFEDASEGVLTVAKISRIVGYVNETVVRDGVTLDMPLRVDLPDRSIELDEGTEAVLMLVPHEAAEHLAALIAVAPLKVKTLKTRNVREMLPLAWTAATFTRVVGATEMRQSHLYGISIQSDGADSHLISQVATPDDVTSDVLPVPGTRIGVIMALGERLFFELSISSVDNTPGDNPSTRDTGGRVNTSGNVFLAVNGRITDGTPQWFLTRSATGGQSTRGLAWTLNTEQEFVPDASFFDADGYGFLALQLYIRGFDFSVSDISLHLRVVPAEKSPV